MWGRDGTSGGSRPSLDWRSGLSNRLWRQQFTFFRLAGLDLAERCHEALSVARAAEEMDGFLPSGELVFGHDHEVRLTASASDDEWLAVLRDAVEVGGHVLAQLAEGDVGHAAHLYQTLYKIKRFGCAVGRESVARHPLSPAQGDGPKRARLASSSAGVGQRDRSRSRPMISRTKLGRQLGLDYRHECVGEFYIYQEWIYWRNINLQ